MLKRLRLVSPQPLLLLSLLQYFHYLMAKAFLGKSVRSDWFSLDKGRFHGNTPSRLLSQQILNLQPRQRKNVNIAILYGETTRKS